MGSELILYKCMYQDQGMFYMSLLNLVFDHCTFLIVVNLFYCLLFHQVSGITIELKCAIKKHMFLFYPVSLCVGVAEALCI